MTSTEDPRPTLAERHAVDLGGRRADANTIVAAGFASSGNVRADLGLTLIRAAEDCRAGAIQIQHRKYGDDVVRMVRDAVINGVHPDTLGKERKAPLDVHQAAVLANMVLQFDAMPSELRDSFRTVHSLVMARVIEGDEFAHKLDSIREVYDQSHPAPRPRVLPGELRALHDWSFPQIVHRSQRGGRWKVFPATASEITETVIKWWITDVCQCCQGRKYEVMPGSRIVSDVLCHECHGIGKPPVEQRLQEKRKEPGRWLASEYDLMVSEAMGAMGQALAFSFDIDLSAQPALQDRLTVLRSAGANQD